MSIIAQNSMYTNHPLKHLIKKQEFFQEIDENT